MVVVVLPPIVDHAAHVAQTGKSVLRQAFVAKATVEAFDAGILRWLADLLPPKRSGHFSRTSKPFDYKRVVVSMRR